MILYSTVHSVGLSWSWNAYEKIINTRELNDSIGILDQFLTFGRHRLVLPSPLFASESEGKGGTT